MARAVIALGVVAAGLIVLLGWIRSQPGQVAEGPATATGQIPPRGYVCYRARGPILIDGKLDEAVWADAPWSEEFRDIEGDRRPNPPLRTRMKMLWDDEALYIAAELEEPHVWGTLRVHDSVIFHDNDFEVFIDPDGDGHLYGELELNALNTTWDLLLSKPYKDGGRAIDAWEIQGLKTAVHVQGTLNDPTDRDVGWTVEIAWPWKSLHEIGGSKDPGPSHGDQWRINFSRVEWDHHIVDGKYKRVPNRPEHNWVWSPQGVIDMHRPERWGILQFSTAPPGTTTFQPDPAQPARDFLHSLYYAQVEYRKLNGRYFATLREGGIAVPPGLHLPELETTRNHFEASVGVGSASQNRWRITDDAHFRKAR